MVSSLAALFGKVEKHPSIGKRKETNTGLVFPKCFKNQISRFYQDF